MVSRTRCRFRRTTSPEVIEGSELDSGPVARSPVRRSPFKGEAGTSAVYPSIQDLETPQAWPFGRERFSGTCILSRGPTCALV